MSRRPVFSRVTCVWVIAFAVASGSLGAQETAVAFEADSVFFDFDARTAVLKDVHVKHGNTAISAAEGRVAADGAAEEWRLTGVVIAVGSAVARAERATLKFLAGQLISSELAGEPVELENPGEAPFRGSATRIAYDDAGGVFSATGNASFSFGAQEVHCDWVYDVRTRKAAGSAGNGRDCRYVLVRKRP